MYLRIFIAILLFRLSLDYAYHEVVVRNYEYMGFVWVSSPVKMIESYLLLFLMYVFMVFPRQDFLSTKIIQTFFLVAYIPLLTLYACSDSSRGWMYVNTCFWMIVTLVGAGKSPPMALFPDKFKTFSYLIAIIISFGAIISAVAVFGLSFKLSVSNVYDIRAENKLSSLPLGGYLIPWAAKVAIPFLFMVVMYSTMPSRRVFLVAIACLQVIIFSVTGHKTFLFIIPSMFFVSLVLRRSSYLAYVAASFALLVLLCTIVDLNNSSVDMTSLITRRVFMVPALLSTFYYDYFDGAPLMLGHSIFSLFVSYDYAYSPAFLIGYQYLGSAELSANNGVVSDGFMNFGYVGVVIWAVALGALIQFANRISLEKDRRITEPLLVMTFLSVVNSALLTTLLTHGLLLAFLLVLLGVGRAVSDPAGRPG